MKRDKIIYWTSTGLIAAGMLLSAAMYLSRNAELMSSFASLGIPSHLVALLGVAKLLGAIALLAPVWRNVKEWTYAGFGFTFVGAIWVHVSTGTPWVGPLIFLLVLSTSYFFWMRINPSSTSNA
jgi:hypothetical protein